MGITTLLSGCMGRRRHNEQRRSEEKLNRDFTEDNYSRMEV